MVTALAEMTAVAWNVMVRDDPVALGEATDFFADLFYLSADFVAEDSSRPVASVDFLEIGATYSSCFQSDEHVSQAYFGRREILENNSPMFLEEAGKHGFTPRSSHDLTGWSMSFPCSKSGSRLITPSPSLYGLYEGQCQFFMSFVRFCSGFSGGFFFDKSGNNADRGGIPWKPAGGFSEMLGGILNITYVMPQRLSITYVIQAS